MSQVLLNVAQNKKWQNKGCNIILAKIYTSGFSKVFENFRTLQSNSGFIVIGREGECSIAFKQKGRNFGVSSTWLDWKINSQVTSDVETRGSENKNETLMKL